MARPDRPLVIQTEDLDPQAAAWLAERATLEVIAHDDPAFRARLPEAEGLVVRTYTQVDAPLLAQAPRLKVVGRAGVALENIDLDACRQRAVAVVHTPGANTRAVVELVTLVMLDALRPRLALDGPVEPARWHELRRELTAPRQVSDLTLGILGLGKIGTGMARVAQALDMRALYHDIRTIPADARHGAEEVDFDTLLAESDIFTIHIDARPGNAKLINEKRLAQLKEDALLINTARGFVMDPDALAAWLRHRPRARAIIDVHDPHEPVGAAYPLLGLPNVRLMPHLGACTARAKLNMSWVVRDVWRVLCGEAPEFPAKFAE
ncbi:MAG: NAD(P)-dependent oxidoreductase [Phycisphaerales bacterium JB039]